MRDLTVLAMALLLCGCPMLGAGSRGSRGSTAGAASNDPQSPAGQARAVLDEMEKKLDAGSTENVGGHASYAYSLLYGPRRLEVADRAELETRWKSLTARLVRQAGPHGAALYGDGTRTAKVHPEAVEVLNAGLKECDRARGFTQPYEMNALEEQYQKYRAQLERAQRLDPNVVSYYAETGIVPDITDHRMRLIDCEYGVAFNGTSSPTGMSTRRARR